MDRYAVIGNPISHSKSPLIHACFAEQTSQNMVYERIEGGIDTFEDQVIRFFSVSSNKGLNVTVPFKERAFAMCDELSARAQTAEAVNTLFMRGSSLVGDNTDGCGIVTDLIENHGVTLSGQRILLLGAGGAVKGVLQPLMEQSPSALVISNRTFSKAEALAGRYNAMAEELNLSGRAEASPLEQLNTSFDVVINGTSASLSGELPNIPADVFVATTAVYDMMYGDSETVFNRWARSQGAGKTMDGLGMLVEQAAEAFRLWRELKPETNTCIKLLRP
jgi:shikimate dehydrogenase